MRPTLRKVGDFLHGKGSYRPVGIDVVEVGQGKQFIADLKVKKASSSLLGWLRGHFCLFWIMLVCCLLHLECEGKRLERMNAETTAGSVVIAGWFEQSKRSSTARIVVGAADGEAWQI